QLVAYIVPTNDQRPTTNDQRQGGKQTSRQGDSDYATHNTQYETPSSILHPPSSILQELRAFLRARLPEYMVPSAFVILAALPVTPNGKLDRQALLASSLPREDTLPSAALGSPIEELLAGIWSALLGRSPIG